MRLVGRYRIEERIGEGAMADVYRAHDPSIDRVLAIKVLKKEFRTNPEIAGRFLREARAAGALSHPNIVTIYDVGEADGYPYIAMELIDGTPLDDHIRSAGKLPLHQVIDIGSQLANALDYANRLDVVHRDIKPSNIMLCEGGGTAKILDFGIARTRESDHVGAEVNALRTQVGQVIGTPRYMSPEQALGLDIDHRSDLFSLGVVLYEMITGKTAFGGTSIATIALQITQQSPEPIRATVPDCPRGMQFIIDKLLAKQPEKRFASGRSLATALKREHDALSAERHSRRRGLPLRWRLTLLIGSVTALALIASIGTALDRQYKTMERMALISGSSIASFVANNVALRAAENATLPPAEQDWLPVQAFVTAASADPVVRKMVMIDANNIVRGTSNPSELATAYDGAHGEAVLSIESGQTVTATSGGDFRFLRTVEYAGHPFGKVELVVASDKLRAAAASSRSLLLGLGAVLFLVVLGVSYGIAQLLARPIGRLREALSDAAAGNLEFRISHKRHDEFGDLFDGFNSLAASLEARSPGPAATPEPQVNELDATRIDVLPAILPSGRGIRRRTA